MSNLTDKQKKLLLAAKTRKRQLQLTECFDANKVHSRANDKQDTIHKDVDSLYKIVRSGNQCLAEGTLVDTNLGPKPIETLRIGDIVYDELGNEQSVMENFYQGELEVVKLEFSTGPEVICTMSHTWWCSSTDLDTFSKIETNQLKLNSCIKTLTGITTITTIGPTPSVICYDIEVSGVNKVFRLSNGIITGNSGKTQLMVRDYVWKLSETHPYWKRKGSEECPKCETPNPSYLNPTTEQYGCASCGYEWISWGTGGLTFLAVLQTGKHIDDMWEKRFKPFFAAGEVKADVKGGILQSVTHTKTKNTIYFFSHDNATEVRKRVQYFVAHDVWIDEMPAHYKVYEELQRRVDAMQGQFTATLTPKVTNIEVKNFLDDLDPKLHTLYRMTKLDNPIYKGREETEMAKLKSLPEADRKAILFGDWIFAGELRLNINMERIKPLPSHYSRTWDHVVGIDPATSGKIGFVIFAKDPQDLDTWWVVLAKHLNGTAPSVLIKEVLPPYTAGLNVVKRIADPHEAWFREESALHGIEYDAPHDKVHRRKELLATGEEALIDPKMMFAEGETDQLVSELNSAVEDPAKPGHIKNATKYHCIDAWIYVLDCLPVYLIPPKPLSPSEQIRHKWMLQEANAPANPQVTNTLPTIAASFKQFVNKTAIRWGRRL